MTRQQGSWRTVSFLFGFKFALREQLEMAKNAKEWWAAGFFLGLFTELRSFSSFYGSQVANSAL